MDIEKAIAALGGPSAAARVIPHTSRQVIEGWLKRGKLPRYRQDAVRAALDTAGVTVQYDD